MSEKCDCKICRRYRDYLDHLERVPKKDWPFWEGLMEKLYTAEEDVSAYEALVIPGLEAQIFRLEKMIEESN